MPEQKYGFRSMGATRWQWYETRTEEIYITLIIFDLNKYGFLMSKNQIFVLNFD